MNMEEAAVKIEGHEHEIKSLKHRMADVERDQQALLKLTASVEVMATKVSRIDEKMTEMEGKSAKRWDSLVDKVIWLIAGACIAALFASAGIAI